MMSAMNAAVPHDSEATAGALPGRAHCETPQVGTWQWDISSGVFSVDPVWCVSLGLGEGAGAVRFGGGDRGEQLEHVLDRLRA